MKHYFKGGLAIFSFLLIIISCSPAVAGTESTATNSKTTTPTTEAHTPTPDPYVITSNNIDSISVLEIIENKSYQAMDWSPDSQYLYLYRNDIADIFDGNNFDLEYSIETSQLMEENDCKTCFLSIKEMKSSPDGSLIGTCDASNPNRITIQNIKTDEVVSEIPNKNSICPTFVISGKHNKVAILGNNNSLLIWNVENTKQEIEIDISGGKALAISPTGDIFTVSTNTNELLIYNFTGQQIKKFPSQIEHAGYNNINSLAYNPSGDLLAVSTDQRMVQFINVSSGKLLNAYTINETVLESKFSPDGKKIVFRTNDGIIHIWVLQNYAQLYPTVTATPTSQLEISYANLPHGQHILYSDDGVSMKVRSIDGSLTQPLTNRIFGIPISADGRILQIIDDYPKYYRGNSLNLLTGVQEFNNLEGKVSPNGSWIADIEYIRHEEGISFHNTSNNSDYFIPLGLPESFDVSVSDHIDRFSWSTDGKHLLYIRYTQQLGTNGRQPPWDVFPTNGLYIIDIDCLQNPETCLETQKFIYSSYKIHYYNLWSLSPDNRYAIVHGGDHFILFDILNGTAKQIPFKIPDITPYYTSEVFISPDNQWVLFSTSDENVYLQPLFGGQATKIMDASEYQYLLGWLTAPYLQPDNSFKVLPAGDHVYIRENPDLDAAEITFLISGNTFTVLDGPVQEDGYTWWYVESDVDGTEGWLSEFYGWYEKIE